MSSTNITPDDVPPLSEQENPTIFDGDIEALNEQAPPLSEQGQKTDYNDGGQGLHKTSHTLGAVYSDQATDGAGHGPQDFATAEEDAAADEDAGKAKPGKSARTRTAKG